MDLSIILAHYLPDPSHKCLDAVKKTIKQLEKQSVDLEIEIIVCDDGSFELDSNLSGQKIKLDDGRHCFDYQDETAQSIAKSRFATDSKSISHWLYLPRTKMVSSKARLWNLATSIAKSDKLIFFDDDNYLLKDSSLNSFNSLLDQYKLVFGQIIDSNHRPRPYTSKRVQGSTFGLHRNLLEKIGGFGIWTEAVSSGIDSDLWYKLYHELKNDTPYSAVFTTAIQTFDGCSKRWKPFVGSIFRHRAVRKAFYAANQCKDYRSPRHNPSRNKSIWMENLGDNDKKQHKD